MVGHQRFQQDGGNSGHFGQHVRDPSAGARFRDRDRRPAPPEQGDHRFGEGGPPLSQVRFSECATDSRDHGSPAPNRDRNRAAGHGQPIRNALRGRRNNFIDVALRHSDRLQLRDRNVAARGKLWKHKIAKHRLHLARHARHREEQRGAIFQSEPRRCPNGVLQLPSAAGEGCLPTVAPRHRDAELPEPRADFTETRRSKHERQPERVGRRFPRQVVFRGTEPARPDHDVRTRRGERDGLDHRVEVVANGGVNADLQSPLQKFPG